MVEDRNAHPCRWVMLGTSEVWVYTEGSSPLLPALHALLGLRQLEPGMGCQTGTGWFLQRLWGGEGVY